MAILTGALHFTGSISNLSAYTMRGHDKIILRAKGGAKKTTIQNSPNFAATRNLNNEWKGVTSAAKEIRDGLKGLSPLADYNISGPLNALVKKIQTADTQNPKGKRSILFSQHPDIISGFNYNRQTLFDSLIRLPLSVSLDRSTGSVDVTTPALQPAIHFFGHPRYAYYRFVLACTVVSDQVWDERLSDYNIIHIPPGYEPVYTPWAPAGFPLSSASYQLVPTLSFQYGPDLLFLFGAGIQYGVPGADGSVQPAPYVGAARILKTV